nr:MAG TPA: hypothetical protein [Caudoviricetes sp.]
MLFILLINVKVMFLLLLSSCVVMLYILHLR